MNTGSGLPDDPAVVQERDRLSCAWLSAVLASRDPVEVLSSSVSAFLGVDMCRSFLVLAFRSQGTLNEGVLRKLWRRLRESCPTVDFLTATIGNDLVLAIRRHEGAESDLRDDRGEAKWLVGILAPLLGPKTVVGVGRVARTGRDIPESAAEARLALNLPGRGDEQPILHIADVPVFGLLSRITDDGAMKKFVEDNIGPLKNEPELLATLQVLLDCNFAVAAASRRMHVHYNTMRYRLERLVSILGPIEGSPQQLLAIQLALYIRKMLPGTGDD